MTVSRIPILNIYYLLCYAWDVLPEKQWVKVSSIPNAHLVDLFASVLSRGLEHLVRQGFDRGYLPIAEDTRLLRGRIRFEDSIRSNRAILGTFVCEADELLPNVLHNQIIKTTMERLAETEGLAGPLKVRLLDQLTGMRDIDSITLSHEQFRRVRLHRNNQSYAFLLNVCELLFSRSLVDERSGKHWFKEFEEDEVLMNQLFERFVRNFYRREQATLQVRPHKIGWPVQVVSSEGGVFLPEMRSDVCLFNNERKIILDCKYYKTPFPVRYGKKGVRSEHLYQIFSYVKNKAIEPGWESCEGILLYASIGESTKLRFETHGHRFNVQTIDLNQDWQLIRQDLLNVLSA